MTKKNDDAKIDTEWNFIDAGVVERLCLKGWSPLDDDGVWAIGAHSELEIPLQAKDAYLCVKVQPHLLPPVIRGQWLEISVAGCRLGGAFLTEPVWIAVPLATNAVHSGSTRIQLHHPNYFAESETGITSDTRRRSIALLFARLISAEPSTVDFDDAPLIQLERAKKERTSASSETRTYMFTTGREGGGLLGEGWWPAEDNLTWASGPLSCIRLPAFSGTGGCFFDLKVHPAQLWSEDGRSVDNQRFTVVVNGCVIGQCRLREDATISLPASAAVVGTDEIDITLLLPDAVQPSLFGMEDERTLAVGLMSLVLRAAAQIEHPSLYRPDNEIDTPITAARDSIFTEFESLGSNCEFGLVQRYFGYEPVDLFRFGTLPLAALLDGLRDDCFKSIGDPRHLTVERAELPSSKVERMLFETHYSLRFHTFSYDGDPGSLTDGELVKRFAAKLSYGRRKFLSGLRTDRRIYVLKRDGPMTTAEALPVFLLLRSYGEARVLFVVDPDDRHKPGDVDLIAPGLMRGYLWRWTNDRPITEINYGSWLKLCANAWLLSQVNLS